MSISCCEKKLLWYLSIFKDENSFSNEICELRFRFVVQDSKHFFFFLELHSFHVEVTGRPEKPRWSCSQVGTEKAKTFHGGCSHVWNVGLSEDCPLRLPDLRLTAHFRLAPDSGFCAALTHLTSSRTFTTVAVPLPSTG